KRSAREYLESSIPMGCGPLPLACLAIGAKETPMTVFAQDWTTPFGLPPFDLIRDEDFAPAFDAALAEARTNIAAIAGSDVAPTFANVIDALELAEGALDLVAGVFYNLSGADSNEAREALMRDLAPKMSAFSSEVSNNKALFARIE